MSNDFINECKNRANGNRLGKIIVDGIDTPITNSDNLQSFEIDSGCYIDGNIIGSVYAKCLKANFIADQNNLTDKSIQVQIGAKYADLNEEYINMGKYTVEHPNNEITAQYSQITAYSDMYTNLDTKYVCNIDYSSGDKTVSDLYIDVCNQLGLTPVTTEFINSTIPIKDNPFTNGEKNRIVLQTIAKISCSFVDINVDTNQIDLCWLSDSEEPDYIFNLNDYSSVEGGQVVCGPINCLIIKNSQVDDENVTITDEESIAEYGEHSIIISEDYILHNAELREQVINDIWNRVKGMKYVDCKLTTYYGKPFLKLGAKIRIYISDNEYFDTYVLKHNFKYDGAFTSVVESPALTDQEIKTKQNISLTEALRNVQIDINKQDGIISAVVETQKGQSSTLDNLIKTQKNDGYIEITDSFETDAVYLSFCGDMHYTYLEESTYLPFFLYDSYLIVEYENSKQRIKLPYFELNYTDDLYDEFKIENTRAYVIHRLDSKLQPLEEELIEELGNISIPLKNGYNKLYMEDFDLNYSLKYNVQSTLTDTLATKAELKITEEAITNEVSKKADDKEIKGLLELQATDFNVELSKKVGNNEVIAKINLSTEKDESESEMLIQANKINIIGVLTAINNDTSTTINGNKITTGSINAQQLSSSSVTADKIQSNAITTDKIQSGAITADKIKANSITANEVASDIITTTTFKAQEINADKITSGTISTDRLSSNVITTTNFSSQTINADKITSGTINGTNVNITNLNASNITTGKISTDRLDASVITTTNFSSQNINASNIKSGTLNIHDKSSTYYLKMGFDTQHPEVSGLNITGNGGIKMNNNSIGGAYDIGTEYLSASGSDGIVKCNTIFQAETLKYKDDSGTYRDVVGLYRWFASGGSDYIDVFDANGSTKLRLNFYNGLYINYTTL